jgi:thioredoxin-like negative regulator of GroEL
VIDRLAARHPNVFKVDASADLEQARAFGVAATPTLMLVEDGRIVRVIVGSTSEKNLESLLHS